MTANLLRRAGEATIRQRDSGRQLKEPIAYFQTVAKVMLEDRRQATEVGGEAQGKTSKGMP